MSLKVYLTCHGGGEYDHSVVIHMQKLHDMQIVGGKWYCKGRGEFEREIRKLLWDLRKVKHPDPKKPVENWAEDVEKTVSHESFKATA